MKLNKTFKKGLIVLFPTLITIVLLVIAIQFLNRHVGRPLGKTLLYFLENVIGNLGNLKDNETVIAIIGLPIAIVVVFFAGLFFASYVGKKAFELWEKTIGKFPVIDKVYPYAKQAIELILEEEKSIQFGQVVLAPYPRQGAYALGFITSTGMKTINDKLNKELVTVFFPTSPMPFTGYFILIPKDELIFLDIAVDEAVRTIVSGGVLIPKSQTVPEKNAIKDVGA